jgi:subtilisin family serine protease
MKTRSMAAVAVSAIAVLLLSDIGPAFAVDSVAVPASTPSVEQEQSPAPAPTHASTPTQSSIPSPSPSSSTASWTLTPLSVESRHVIIQSPQGSLPLLLDAVASVGLNSEFTYTKALYGVAVTATSAQLNAVQAVVPGLIVSDQLDYEVADTMSNAPWNQSMLDDATYPPDSSYTYPASAGADVKVYVIDTGATPNPGQFGSRLDRGADFTNSGTTSDCNGHGTHVAGTVGSDSYGVAKKVTIVPLHALAPANDCASGGKTSNVIAAIEWAIQDNPAGKRAVINMSLGPTIPSGQDSAMDTAISNAIKDGIVVVVAAGNNGNSLLPSFRDACGYSPANSPGALTVGAVDSGAYEANFSNYGSCVSLFAPGVDIRSLDYMSANSSVLMSGTSMASPHVAGAVALYIAEHPTETPAEIRKAILDSALTDKVGFYSGHSGSPNLLLNISSITHPSLANSTPVTLTIAGGTPGGKPKVGGSIAAVPGTWTSTASVTRSYEWFSCDTSKTASTTSLPGDCVKIPGETTNQLSVTGDMAYKHILSAETATASSTKAIVYSASQGPVAIAPSIITDPEVSGIARVGETLSVTDGTWDGSPSPTFTYRWYACASPVAGAANYLDSSKGCAVISNAADATFTLQSAQLNKYVIAEVRALNDAVSTAVSRFTVGLNKITQAPLNTVSPALTLAANAGADGKPRFFGTDSTSTRLTTSTGTWTGTPTITFQYKWYRCPTAVSASSNLEQGCLEIATESLPSYTVRSADVGRTVLSEVIATNGLASVSAFSASTAIVGQPPSNLFAPSISSSGVRVGDVLTGDDGTWDGADAFTRQWFACSATTAVADGAPATSPKLCVAIPNETSQSFTLTSEQLGKFIVFEVRATNTSGGTIAVKKSSAATVAVTEVPVNTIFPVISVGTPSAANSTPRYAGAGNPSTPLTVSRGTWTGTPTITYSYDWYRCDAAISASREAPDGCTQIAAAANQTTYTVTADDAGKFISAAVIATNGAGEAVKFSASTAAVATTPVNTGAPEIVSVEPFVGNALNVSNGTWGGAPTPTYSYAWFSCASTIANSGTTLPSGCSAIAGATSARFVIPSALIGKYFVARVTATNAAVTSATAPVRFTASTTATAKQGPTITFTLPGANGAPRFTGVATTSSLLTVSNGTWDGTGVTTYAYEWYSCTSSVSGSLTRPSDCTAIPGVTTNTFRVTSAQSGRYISAAVSATNSLGTRKSWSPSTSQVTTPPANTASPSITGNAFVGRTVTANPGTWTGAPDPTYSYTWYSCTSAVVSSMATVPGGCVLIPGAATSAYSMSAAQANKFLVVSVTALNGAVDAPGVTKFSVSSAKVLTEPTNTSAVRMSSSSSAGSSPISGSLLTAVPGTWTGSPTIALSYEWYTCSTSVPSTTTSKPDQCDFISGATSSTYTVTDDLAGTFITVAETARNPASSKTKWSAVSASVVTRPVRDSDPTISGDAVAGSTITAVAGSVTATPVAQPTFAWFACPSVVIPTSTVPNGCLQRTSATGLTYVLTSADAGLFVTARETATNVAGSSIRFSASTSIVKAPPANSTLNPVTVGTAAASGAPRVGGSVSTDSGTSMVPLCLSSGTEHRDFARRLPVHRRRSGPQLLSDG